MNQVLTSVDAHEVTTHTLDSSTLKFVEDIDYEFVGGGNAVNGY